MILTTILDIVFFTFIIILIYFFRDKLFAYLNKIYEKELVTNEKWMPIEQIKEFRQLFYLFFAGLLFINLYYLFFNTTTSETIFFCSLFDFLISVLAGVYIFDKNKKVKTFILLMMLTPLTGYSLTGYIGGYTDVVFTILAIIHCMAILYVIICLIKDFKIYSKSNKLGYTIFLLYGIIFVCVLLSTFAEGLSLLDSLVYCSNAFTSNGYGLVNATDPLGKVLSLILVWSGYILSGVSTALLTLALVSRYYKKRLSNLKKRIHKQDMKINEINESQIKMDEKLDMILKKI